MIYLEGKPSSRRNTPRGQLTFPVIFHIADGVPAPEPVTPNVDRRFKEELLAHIKILATSVGPTPKVLLVDGQEIYLHTEFPSAIVGAKGGVLGTFKFPDPQNPHIKIFAPLTTEEEQALIKQSLPAPRTSKVITQPIVTINKPISGVYVDQNEISVTANFIRSCGTSFGFGCMFGTLFNDLALGVSTVCGLVCWHLIKGSFHHEPVSVRRVRRAVLYSAAVFFASQSVLNLLFSSDTLRLHPTAIFPLFMTGALLVGLTARLPNSK